MNEVRQISDAGNKFSVYFAIVLEDKLPNEETIFVQLLELNPFVDGKVEIKTDSVKVGDALTDSYEIVEVSNSIKATYFSFLTNRAYAPDVKKNEQVLVFRYADSYKYYWFPLGRDDYLRRTERVTIRASNNLTVPQGLSDNNSYTIELDTKYQGHILIKTSKTSGEKFQYQIKIDTQKNTLQLCDDKNNQVLIDSNVPRVMLTNTNGSTVDVVKNNINLIAPEDIIVKAGRQILFNAPVICAKNEQGSGVTEWNSKNISINGSSSVVVKSPSIGLNGSVVAKTVSATHVKAGGYSTGSVSVGFNLRQSVYNITKSVQEDIINSYNGAEVDLYYGTGTDPNNKPQNSDFNNSDRHCAAWEEVHSSIDQICSVLDSLSGAHYNPSIDTSGIRSTADAAIMSLNRGR